ncbi:hypothetical protein O7635_18540 [Asanoa sp. WMMD1127]|uniref:hypothetical protein n=1 Tax=Asanoa sp. WMMD1127 TaxID=3016107 RepID=UPI0024173A77|nr:hypothetical protein [Asanoa sp. WMMD1127]MDG4823858.1 hypothetical protein [Asanoa sp. WMMD1127]
MDKGAVVRVADLRVAVERLLAEVERDRGAEVDLGADYYLVVPLESAYELHAGSPQLTMGQLSDDVASLRELLERDDVCVWHDLAHVVGILTRLAALDLAATPPTR